MNRPIYEEFDLAKPHKGHAGLWYEKYCNTWRDDPFWTLKATSDTAPKLDWVKTVTGTVRVKIVVALFMQPMAEYGAALNAV